MFKFFGRKPPKTESLDLAAINGALTDDAQPMQHRRWSSAGVNTGRLSDRILSQNSYPLSTKQQHDAVLQARNQEAAQLVRRLRRANVQWLNTLLHEDATTLPEIMSTKRLDETSHKLGNFTLEAMESDAVEALDERIEVIGAAIEYKAYLDDDKGHPRLA